MKQELLFCVLLSITYIDETMDQVIHHLPVSFFFFFFLFFFIFFLFFVIREDIEQSSPGR